MFSFSKSTFGYQGFHLKKLKIIQWIIDLARGREISDEQ